MAEVKITIEALDQVSKKLDDIDKKAQKTKKSLEDLGKIKVKEPSTTSIRAKSSIASQTAELTALDKITNKATTSLSKLQEKQKALIAQTIYKQDQDIIKKLSKVNESLTKRNQEYQNNILAQQAKVSPINYLANQMGVVRKIEGGKTILASQLDPSKHGIFKLIDDYKGNYNKFLKTNFEKELKETLNKRKTENQQKLVIEKKQAKEQELLNKERSRAIVQETMFQKKVADGFVNAKATPINYIRDVSGRIIGIAKAGAQATASQFASIRQLGGSFIPPAPPRGGGSNEGGFLGGRRTFGQVLGGYLAYKTAVGVENAVGATLGVAPTMEQLRAQLGAMDYASGVRDKNKLSTLTESHIKFLYKKGSEYGKNFLDIAPEYARMLGVSSIKGSKFNNQQIRDIVEAFMGLTSVSGSTKEQTKGTFLAVSQMLSKGFIRGEELNRQLRDHLPIGTPMIELAVKKTLNDPNVRARDPKIAQLYDKYLKGGLSLDELVDKGVVGSGNLINMLTILKDTFGSMPQEKAKIFNGQMQRLSNEFTMLIDNFTKNNFGTVGKGLFAFNEMLGKVNNWYLHSELSPTFDAIKISKAKKATPEQIKKAHIVNTTKELGGAIALGFASSLGLAGLGKVASFAGWARTGAFLSRFAGPAGATIATGIAGYDLGNFVADYIDDKKIKKIEEDYKKQIKENKIKKKLTNVENTRFGVYGRQGPETPLTISNFASRFNNFLLGLEEKEAIDRVKAGVAKNLREKSNDPSVNPQPNQPQQSTAPQQIELILRFEGGNLPNGIKPVITTTRGDKLNLGTNIISGGAINQSYAY